MFSTKNQRLSRVLITAAMMAVLALAVACGGGESSDGGSSSSEIVVDGSSTVFPITQAVAEEFRRENSSVQIPVGISGTGGGFKRFVVGDTDIQNASREIKESEAEEAAANGVEFIEISVAWDGLSVIANKSNDFADCLTTEELKSIWDADSELNNWNQVRSSFPDKPLRLYGPDTDSGTFDYFTHAINGEEDRSRSDYTASADDNTLVQGVAGDGGSLGYFGYAYFSENADKLKVLGVDSGSGCVSPSIQTINDGSYSPLSRQLYIYVNKASLERQEVKDFITFFMNEGGALAEEVGYVALSDADYRANLELLGLN
jgi:phosphate transport system substrate-binding protein